MSWPGRGSWLPRLVFSIIEEDGAASANVYSVSSYLEFPVVPDVVQCGSEFLTKTCRKAQTRIPRVAVLDFGWFLERGSDVVQGGSYISHLLPIHKSVQTVRGFLANQGGGGSIHTVSPILLHLPTHTWHRQDICRFCFWSEHLWLKLFGTKQQKRAFAKRCFATYLIAIATDQWGS